MNGCITACSAVLYKATDSVCFLMIHSLTQQLSKAKPEIQASKTELESAELPILTAILDQTKTPEPSTPTLCSMDREREMARKREQERRRREAVSTIHLWGGFSPVNTFPQTGTVLCFPLQRAGS